jgi:hypothetical protein
MPTASAAVADGSAPPSPVEPAQGVVEDPSDVHRHRDPRAGRDERPPVQATGEPHRCGDHARAGARGEHAGAERERRPRPRRRREREEPALAGEGEERDQDRRHGQHAGRQVWDRQRTERGARHRAEHERRGDSARRRDERPSVTGAREARGSRRGGPWASGRGRRAGACLVGGLCGALGARSAWRWARWLAGAPHRRGSRSRPVSSRRSRSRARVGLPLCGRGWGR